MKLNFWAVIAVVVIAQTGTTFFQGFWNGLRASLTTQSSCYKAILSSEKDYVLFTETMAEQPVTISGDLHSFKNFVNQVTATASTCKMQSLIDNIDIVIKSYINFTNNTLDSYAKYLLTNMPTLTKDFGQVRGATDSYSRGFYVGKMFSIVFRFTI
jgi:hypothetical protein